MALVDVTMPKMGESITEGTVIAWHKAVGDAVDLDETLLEIGTDKVDTEVPSPAAGTLAEILVEEGATVEVGARIAVIATGAPVAAGASPPAPVATSAPAAPTPSPVSTSPQPEADAYSAPAAPASGDGAATPAPLAEEAGPLGRTDAQGRFLSPLVRSIAEKEGVSLGEISRLEGSGREGRVSKSDLLGYVEARTSAPAPAPAAPQPVSVPQTVPAAAPAAPALAAPPQTAQAQPAATNYGDRVEIIEMDRMRRIIAEHMVRSKATSPHVTSFAEIDVTNLVRQRERNKEAFEKREGVKLTFTPYFIHAAVEALRAHPVLNASVEGNRILIKKDYHIGMAVAIGTAGLVAPVLRDAGGKNLVGLARAAADVAARARSKQLQPDELQGGTFTVTNIGSLGSLMGTPIINQPQVGILATGAIKKRPVVVEDPILGDVIAIRQMMYVSLSYDHRIVDGSLASSFLQKYTQVIEGIDPNGML